MISVFIWNTWRRKNYQILFVHRIDLIFFKSDWLIKIDCLSMSLFVSLKRWPNPQSIAIKKGLIFKSFLEVQFSKNFRNVSTSSKSFGTCALVRYPSHNCDRTVCINKNPFPSNILASQQRNFTSPLKLQKT